MICCEKVPLLECWSTHLLIGLTLFIQEILISSIAFITHKSNDIPNKKMLFHFHYFNDKSFVNAFSRCFYFPQSHKIYLFTVRVHLSREQNFQVRFGRTKFRALSEADWGTSKKIRSIFALRQSIKSISWERKPFENREFISINWSIWRYLSKYCLIYLDMLAFTAIRFSTRNKLTFNLDKMLPK